MKKKDLKSKMVVKCRNGGFYLVVDDVIVKEDSFNILSTYSENLLSNDNNAYDIVEIFEIENKYHKFNNNLGMSSLRFKNIGDNENLKSIWKRTAAYDGGDLVEGEKFWIVSKIGGISAVDNFDYKDYNTEYKYFYSATTALIYIDALNSPLFYYKDFAKFSEKEFEEHCENIIKKEFLKRLKDVEL